MTAYPFPNFPISLLAVVMGLAASTGALGQTVARVTSVDVAEAKAHPQCSGGILAEDSRPMPEGNREDMLVASYMRQFRDYRNATNHSPNMMIHINNDTFKSDARIRDVTPNYFHIETFGSPQGNQSYCIDYTQIVQVNYDKGFLHISIRR